MSLLQTGWTTAPLGRVAELNARTLPETTDPGFEFRYVDIGSVGRGALIEEPETLTFENSPSRARRILRPGDTIVSTVRTYLRAVMRVPEDATDLVGSTGFVVLTARAQLDSRFLSWFSQADPFIEEVVARSVGVSYPAIAPSELARFPIPIPPLTTQRAIADFLDAETARIDALIAKKRRQQVVLLEHEEAVLLDLLGDWRTESHQTLRQYGTLAVTGPFGTQLAASEYVDGGIPVINPVHIERGRFRPEDEVTVPSQVAHRLRRHRLSMGDIVLGRKGDVGRSAIVTSKEDGWICGSDSIAVRTDPQRLNSEFLVRLLSIDLYRQQLQATSTGTTMANVNQSTLLNLRLPALSRPEQDRRLSSAEHAVAAHEAIILTLNKQLHLLAEHRQALITAAVTGRIEVPGGAVQP